MIIAIKQDRRATDPPVPSCRKHIDQWRLSFLQQIIALPHISPHQVCRQLDIHDHPCLGGCLRFILCQPNILVLWSFLSITHKIIPIIYSTVLIHWGDSISQFVPKFPVNNIPALVQIMAWRRPLSEPMLVNLQTHICVTRTQWVSMYINTYCENDQLSFRSAFD